MAWPRAGSARTAPLPSDWPALRRHVLDRDGHLCRWVAHGVLCLRPANEVDHIDRPDDHTPGNLRALCRGHHAVRTARQGGLAAHRHGTERRRPEAHPGARPGR